MKFILAGTGNFGYQSFKKIIENYEVLAIVTQPDKPANRGMKIKPNPVKELALENNIKLYQPDKIGKIYDELSVLDFDYLLSASFGQYVPMKVLDLAKKGSLNIHGSLLPKYRGAAPIQYSLLNGDDKTGITLMYMAKEMDAGDMLAKAQINIEPNDIADDLFIKLADLASENIVKWLNNLDQGILKPISQNHDLATLSPKLFKEDSFIDFKNMNAQEAINKMRAFATNPGAWTMIDDKRIKLYNAVDDKSKISPKFKNHPSIIELETKDKKIYLIDYQIAGKKRISNY
ncbi:methionyl-tRNA formyltransferase [Mycoplasma testudineum]|uniref:Methionyl-tRNA formyltransferase n=1 Tax=Mycoplasma testudineum TaxID=244584 RepID=A0A4V3C312_9MOLU|nr:methionyl-tRNA formyltransferase [Mycoplasma testudineum]OYD26815.1 methionyl-tRNA formyltransferase [Mycoplasma testudineum]TDO20349.1 methionyl-tRNA formyltransferase [Mycoplasma testudineum]